MPFADLLEQVGRWLLVAAVPAAMLAPVVSFGPVRLGASDALAVGGAACWVLAWMISRSRPAMVGVAGWPALACIAGALSMTESIELAASIKGLAQLFGLWILPSVAVAELFTTDRWQRRVLSAASVGALLAAVLNVVAALRMGVGNGLPQVWGAASGFQGYFQVIGLTVALPRLATALSARRALGVAGWSSAASLHTAALLFTQTRGAWLAALVAIVTLAFVWRRVLLVAACCVIAAGLAMALSPESAGFVGERMNSIFQPEAQASGFESSVIRIALVLTSWNMFLAHPLTGVGLKSFALVLPYYAPPGMPLIVEMGADQVPIPIEGPHNTFLSLLAETGVLGAIAMVGWIAGAWRGAYQWNHALATEDTMGRQIGATLLAAIPAIAVFCLFSEMNASGAIPLVVILALGHRLARQPHLPAARG